MSEKQVCGVLVVGHGSRREEANRDVCDAARQIAQRGNFALVEAAFLEIATPDIHQGFARLVEHGARHIIVHPYFLSPGRHTRGDIPIEVAEAARRHIGITYHISEPLNAHPLVIEASIERIRQTTGIESNSRELRTARYGTVHLVGAGPGDPGLMTIRARDLLESCDVVIYDNLVNPELLAYAPKKAERIYVGKVGGGRQTPQEDINDLLIKHALLGRRVVRLKGGDPFIFGRGGEEAEALKDRGIEFEIVPGISSALAAPAYAGIPLTHRRHASSVAIVTGARADDCRTRTETINSISGADTIVILMGISHIREIAQQLIAVGRLAETPVAIVRWGTYEGQQTVTGTLQTIADDALRAGMRAPAVIVIGEVVRLRDQLKWFETRFAAVTAAEELEEELELALAFN